MCNSISLQLSLSRLYFSKRFQAHNTTKEKVQHSYTPYPYTSTASSNINILCQSGTVVTTDESTLRHHHPESIVCQDSLLNPTFYGLTCIYRQTNLEGGTVMVKLWLIIVKNIYKWQEIENKVTNKFSCKKKVDG